MTLPPRLSWTDVRDTIRARILSRDLAPGDKLPRDADIAQDMGCARITVHRAMQDLALAGLVERRRKGGTHVRADPIARAGFDIPITRREVEDAGHAYAHRLIRRALEDTPPPVMARFGLHHPVRMLRVIALHLADDRPYIREDRWIDPRSMPAVLDLDLTRNSANEWLVRHRPYSRIDVRCHAVNLADAVAGDLDVPVGTAALVIERTTWLGDDPITSVQAVAHPGYQLIARS